ncbi:MAG: GspH/FimT family pseudopilin [Kiloniellales bacterium]
MNARGRRGFTLIELLVVLLIMGALLTLAPIAFQRLVPGMELKAAAREVAAVFREARGLAIRGNRETSVIVDTEARSYRLAAADRSSQLDSGLGVELTTAVSERIGESAGRIRFFPDGTSTGGRVTLTRGERKYFILVDWLSGRVRILDNAS